MLKLLKSLLFYIFAVPFSLTWLYLGSLGIIEGVQSLSWPCVSGTVKSLGVMPYATKRWSTLATRHAFSLNYSFTTDGVERNGNRITTDDLLYGEVFTVSFRSIDRLKGQFVPGKEVRVCYDPNSPERSALLQPGISFGSLVRFVGGLLVALVVVLPRISPRFRRSE